MATRTIYQFYAELCEYTPKIWRRFQTADSISMARLGYIIMTMFEMQASHLFRFDVPFMDNLIKAVLKDKPIKDLPGDFDIKSLFSPEDKNWRVEIIDENSFDYYEPQEEKFVDAIQTTVSRVITNPGDVMTFSYDYGDGWTISIVLEEITRKSELPAKELPRVLEGEGYGIIEDCGGPYELEELAAEFKKKKGPRYRELREWMGIDSLNLSAFDIDDMNFRLKKVPRIYADIYEYDLEPTKRSWDILTRKYLQ